MIEGARGRTRTVVFRVVLSNATLLDARVLWLTLCPSAGWACCRVVCCWPDGVHSHIVTFAVCALSMTVPIGEAAIAERGLSGCTLHVVQWALRSRCLPSAWRLVDQGLARGMHEHSSTAMMMV